MSKQPTRTGNITFNDSHDGEDFSMDEAAPLVPETTESAPTAPARETVDFSTDEGTEEFMLPLEAVAGKNHREKINNLKFDLQDSVSIIGYPRVHHRQIGETTNPYLVIKVADDKHKVRVLNITYRDMTKEESEPVKFLKYTAALETNERARQVDIKSLKPNTTAADIRAAFAAYGSVEHVRVWPKKYGRNDTTTAATVFFKTAESVSTLLEDRETMVFVGSDSGRITRLGTHEVVYPTELVIKLTNLPQGTTPLKMKGLYKRYPQCAITIPVNHRNGRRFREAFVAFTDKAAYESATAKDLKIDDTILQWVAVDRKLCNECGSPDHLMAACPTATRRIEEAKRRQAEKQRSSVVPSAGKSAHRYKGAVPKTSVGTTTVQGKSYSQTVKMTNQANTKVTSNQSTVDEYALIIKAMKEELAAERQKHAVEIEHMKASLTRMENMVTTMWQMFTKTQTTTPNTNIPHVNESRAGIYGHILAKQNENNKRQIIEKETQEIQRTQNNGQLGEPSLSPIINTQSTQNTSGSQSTQPEYVDLTMESARTQESLSDFSLPSFQSYQGSSSSGIVPETPRSQQPTSSSQ
ncbi:hypothetical protein BGX28_010534 [Mortierella sp. GBA30]|nr:hypothetical protein BGX28_010534 [Mortierella sp. GBA30]